MKTYFSCITQDLLLLPNTSIPIFNNIVLTNNNKFADNFKQQSILLRMGTMQYDSLFDNPRFDLEIEGPVNDRDISFSTLAMLEAFVNSFWLVKDNAVNVTYMHSYSEGLDSYILRYRDALFSSCDGEHNPTSFSTDDVIKAWSKFGKMCDLFSESTTRQESELNKDGIENGPVNITKYKTQNRINRAFMFLRTGRSTQSLLAKIGYYVSILETLLADINNRQDLTYKISERCAFYLHDNQMSKRETFNLVKKAYDIRSAYFHGSKPKFNIALDMKDVCQQVDFLIRQIFNKVIESDSELFLDENRHKAFFDDIVFR